jgi:hypothetical protein
MNGSALVYNSVEYGLAEVWIVFMGLVCPSPRDTKCVYARHVDTRHVFARV